MAQPDSGGRRTSSARSARRSTAKDFERAFDDIKGHLAAGDTYQVNFTFKMAGRFRRRSACALCRPDRGAARPALAPSSASATGRSVRLRRNCFSSWMASSIRARPMKGTARRGRTLAEDRRPARRAARIGQAAGRERDDRRHDSERPGPDRGCRQHRGPRAVLRRAVSERLADDVARHGTFAGVARGDLRGAASVRVGDRGAEGADDGDPERARSRHRAASTQARSATSRRTATRSFNVAIRTAVVDIAGGTRRIRHRQRNRLGLDAGGGVRGVPPQRRRAWSGARPVSSCSRRCGGRRTKDSSCSIGISTRLRESAELFRFRVRRRRCREPAWTRAVEDARSGRSASACWWRGTAGIRVECATLVDRKAPLRVALAAEPIDLEQRLALSQDHAPRTSTSGSRAQAPQYDDVILWNRARGR